MKTSRIGLVILAVALMTTTALAWGGKNIKKEMSTNGWRVKVILSPLPHARYIAEGDSLPTHNLRVDVRAPEGIPITDANISYEFLQGNTLVESGSIPFMVGDAKAFCSIRPAVFNPGSDELLQNISMGEKCVNLDVSKGRFATDIMLPEPDDYTMNILLTVNGQTTRFTSDLDVPY